MSVERVPDALDGERLDVVVAELFEISRSRAAARIVGGEVQLDGRPVSKQQRVRAGQAVRFTATATAPPGVPAPPLPPVRFEDDHLIVLVKPAGLVVHPGHGQPDGTLVDALAAAGVALAPAGGKGRPGIVHRLDRDTSGLLMVAKTDAAHAGLVEALQQRRVARRYLALVEGVPQAPRGRIEGALGRDPGDRTRFTVRDDGKAAVTRYRVLDQAPVGEGRSVALLACALETGRTHQIRVHLSALGHPLLADPTYRASASLAASLDVPRVALHAGRLALVHPVTGETVEVTEPLPDDLDVVLARAGLHLPVDWWQALDTPTLDTPTPATAQDDA
ncbi:RluA family pseudouridine synthase [Egicoccus halophilus]|uniref:Pseudouridine synthase n=1 Tax=Egicoccus halophilus TaxID=1670830 RepID=A0A8J3AD53_9ACTN|nr:RluA family pseudouridine synthase [Egicoccus halophilus]GGI04357.1 pseudouridine synthase [Egicoccus halophilus]